MTTKTFFLSLSLTLAATPALADSDWAFDAEMPLAGRFEIAVGGGYLQGGGDSGIGGDVRDLAGPGGNAEVQIGYRITPNLVSGLYGTFDAYSTGDRFSESTHDAGGASIGLKSDWHFRPSHAVDPWISLGGGFRWLAVDHDNTDTVKLRGVDLARIGVGVDYRITPTFAISPMVTATATRYLQTDTEMTSGFEDIDDKQISWTFGAGLLGRFNL
jgi:hypothetical protein